MENTFIARLRTLLRSIAENPDLEDEDRAALQAVLELIDDPALPADLLMEQLRAHYPALVASLGDAVEGTESE